ncbi:hypothetical protein KAM348_26900 [Aeromonas caviae]|uniref:Uncharacterized protein n=1 Tax=Aeromonas caviae TaxID=648 RepID=A0AAI9KT85_AERCA|nr:hypothetical protein KAM348_26900 [Aeromonas caviae]GJB02966.1 hypothetical protein KAM360_19090 [Aeromonas caviae]
MGAEQHAGKQIGKDHRLAEAPENGHQHNGEDQQDQHIGVHPSLSFICPAPSSLTQQVQRPLPIWHATRSAAEISPPVSSR